MVSKEVANSEMHQLCSLEDEADSYTLYECVSIWETVNSVVELLMGMSLTLGAPR